MRHFHCPKCGGAYNCFQRIRNHLSKCDGTRLRDGHMSTSTGDIQYKLQGWESEDDDIVEEIPVEAEPANVPRQNDHDLQGEGRVESPEINAQDILLELASGHAPLLNPPAPHPQAEAIDEASEAVNNLEQLEPHKSVIDCNTEHTDDHHTKSDVVQTDNVTSTDGPYRATHKTTKEERISQVKERVGPYYVSI